MHICVFEHTYMHVYCDSIFFTAALLDAKAHSERAAPITYPGRSRLASYGRVPFPNSWHIDACVLRLIFFLQLHCSMPKHTRAAPITYPGRSRLAGYGRFPFPQLCVGLCLFYATNKCSWCSSIWRRGHGHGCGCACPRAAIVGNHSVPCP